MEIVIAILFSVSAVFVLLGLFNTMTLIVKGRGIDHIYFSNATIFALSVLFQVYFWASELGLI